MATTVKVQEAKTHLSALLARVEGGEEIVIARGDTPVARLVSVSAGAPGRQRKMGGVAFRLPESFFEELTEDELGDWDGAGLPS